MRDERMHVKHGMNDELVNVAGVIFFWLSFYTTLIQWLAVVYARLLFMSMKFTK